jgi:glycosyltransferase involved in cell wall biosynthesis
MSEGLSVAILMGTYNGSKYIGQQLDSIFSQTHSNWRLFVSDDGSSDETITILKAYQERWGQDRLLIREGPRDGFCKNFLSMACDPSIDADFYAFCDQDDVWMPEKLAVAIGSLDSGRNALPQLYCGRTIYVSDTLARLGLSLNFKGDKNFSNAIVQSIAGGNTMLFNRTAKALLERVGVVNVPSHDWWLYILVTASGGEVVFDSNPYVHYRQQNNSLVGLNTSAKARIHRLRMMLAGKYRDWNDRHVASLLANQPLLDSNSKKILNDFVRLRQSHLFNRLKMIFVCRIRRQGSLGFAGLLLALALKKI